MSASSLNATMIEAKPTPMLPTDELQAVVAELLARREEFLALADRHGAPLYIFEPAILRERAGQFRAAFEERLASTGFYYAMKSNNRPELSETLLDCGYGLDVSSGIELSTALELGARSIVFSGPGKTDDELALALEHVGRVTILIDSFGELERLATMTAARHTCLRAGVRISTGHHGIWRKFGIPLEDLRRFWEYCEAIEGVDLRGIQLHTSWNLDPERQVAVIEALGDELAGWPVTLRSQIAFVDIGGGFWPSQGEWLQFSATPEGQRYTALEGEVIRPLEHYRQAAQPIEAFADALVAALETHLLVHTPCRICFEPGRWLCNDSMYFLLRVIDKKSDDLAITDAGTNAIGWERFESDYAPVINLTRPALVERPCHVLGSLCTPHDVWGYAYWGEDLQAGDLLLIPWQGAYTYSLRQNFIKPLPGFVTID